MSEVDLMQRVAAGDGSGIRDLVDAHYDAVFRFLRHLTGNWEDAEDLTQDVFLSARAKGASFTGAGSIRSWLTTIAINADKKRRRRERLRQICRLDRPGSRNDFDSMIDSEWLLGGLAKLPRDQRLALLLHDVHGFSVREISSIAQCPEGTVKARLHYARKTLQEILVCPDKETNNA